MADLFLSAFHMSVSASYLIMAVILARFLLKRAPKNIICILWLVVGLRLICPFTIESAFSLLPKNKTDTFWYTDHTTFDMEHTPQIAGKPLQKALVTEPLIPKHENKLPDILDIAAFLWFGGILLLLAYFACNWHRIKKCISTAIPAEYAGTRFYWCDNISTPFLFGLAAPKIYVPFSISEPELSYVLRHEAAHKHHYDHLIKPAGFLLLAFYWFQPTVWIAYILLCRDIELACDERVVKALGADCKQAYSKALLTCAVNCQTIAAYPVAFGEIGVKNRVKNILNYKKANFWVLLTAVVVCVIVTVCFATETKSQNISQPEIPENAQAETTQIETAKSAQKTRTQKASDTENEAAEAASPDVDKTKNIIIHRNIRKWAEAFCNRDRETIDEMLRGKIDEAFADTDIIQDSYSFGWSSPWPWRTGLINNQQNYTILSAKNGSAVILYYAWTSDPHVTVWYQKLNYQYYRKQETIFINPAFVETRYLDNISTADEFYAAYPSGMINHQMNYRKNGVGEALNYNALADSSNYYKMLFQPDTAAVYLLNITHDTSAVTTKVSDKNGETIVTFTFLEDGSTASIKMVQPYGSYGIWIPQTNTTN